MPDSVRATVKRLLSCWNCRRELTGYSCAHTFMLAGMALNMIRRGTQLGGMSMVVLVLLHAVPFVVSLGLNDSLSWGRVVATGPQGSEPQSNKASAKALKVDLVQYHHEKSPYATPNLSLEARVSIAVKSSLERAERFSVQIAHQSSSRWTSSKTLLSSSVYSNQGSYLMEIQLGTPTKTFVSIADTGSDLVWVQCLPCYSCFSQPDSYFNPSQSSTYSPTTCGNTLCDSITKHSCSSNCQYQYAYGDQSTTQGVFALDSLTLSSQSFSGFGFGCGNQNQGTFSGTDGLVGLGQGPLSLVSQLGSQFGFVFSYCLVSFYSSTSDTSQLLLGSTGGSVTYTPLVSNPANPSFYYVNLEGISVGGNQLSIPSGTFSIDASGNNGFILDSGTTVTQLQMAAYTPLLDTLESLIDYPRVDGSSIGFDLCYDLSGLSNPSFPTVTFQFESMNVDLPANNVFLQVDNSGDYCLAMQGSNFGFGIFGNVQQQNFNIAYNRATHQVGFAPRTC